MTFQEWVVYAMRFQAAQKNLRAGQALMNALCLKRPDLYSRVISVVGLDCFYDNTSIGNFMSFIVEHWNGKESS
jgi:hypothetical protein